MDCTPFPAREEIGVLSYVTHGILVPVIFGIGLMGNFVTVVLSNHASLRKDNAVFVHICGLAVTNAIALLCTVPATLQEVEIFPANVTFSRPMAYADMVCYIFGKVSHHASLWLLVVLGFFALHSAKNPYKDSRWIRNSTNRIVVFVLVLVCALANFPRFLEVSVREVVGHCFVGMSIWSFEVTEFGSQQIFTEIYPWIVTGLCHALPLALVLVGALLLWRHAGWRRLRRSVVALRPAVDPDDRQLGLVKAVWIALLVGFSLELPTLALRVAMHVTGLKVKDDLYIYCAMLIADYLSLIQKSIGFFVYTIYCSDFRKALRRTFCCLCADEFYEPCACCSAAYRRHLKEIRKLDDEGRKSRKRVISNGRHRKRDYWYRKPARVPEKRQAYNNLDMYRNGSVYSGVSVTMTTTSGYPSESVASASQYDVIEDLGNSGSVGKAGGGSPSFGHVVGSTSSGQAVGNGCVSRDTDDVHPWV